ncbi:Rv1157c family protein [Corynebacterium sp. S7]
MRFSSKFRRTAITAIAAVIAMAGLLAQPASASESTPATNPIDASSNVMSSYIDELGRPTDYTVGKVNEFASQPWVPDDVENMLRAGVSFFAGTDGELGGPELPTDAPHFTQFYWPTVSSNCIGEGLHSTASALAVPGPAENIAPAPQAGQTTFVFTALGTPPAAEAQGGMNVYWFNVNNLRAGVTPLDNNGINKTGPATLSGLADTGSGTVIAVVNGSVKTETNTCSFAPTAALINVR